MLKGLIRAVQTYKRAKRSPEIAYAKIYLDKSTGEIWCNYYSKQNSCTTYYDKNIVCISERLHKPTFTAVRKAAKRAIEF